MDKFIFYQKDFLKCLSAYVNGGCLTKIDLIISIISNSLPFKKNVKKIIRKFNELTVLKTYSLTPTLDVEIEPYRGRNTYVLKMSEYLSSNLKEDLYGAYVHGSLGTYEENAYSDFDAVVILKNDVFSSPKRIAKVAERLNNARAIMFDFDPLQHHGWFVLTELDFNNYPERYFPHILFRYAKSLLRNKGLEIKIHLNDSIQFGHDSFHSVTANIMKCLQNHSYPRNMYQLKGLLSQVMLLPALYIHARYNKGIYKKFSFEGAKKDFSNKNWSVMDEISSIRLKWKYSIPKHRRWIMTRPNYLGMFFSKKFAPKISTEISSILMPEFYSRLETLILLMQGKVNQNE